MTPQLLPAKLRLCGGVAVHVQRTRTAHRTAATACSRTAGQRCLRAETAALRCSASAAGGAPTRRRVHGARRAAAPLSVLEGAGNASTADEDAALLAEAQRVLTILYTRRDMTPNEVRLVLMIEDPRAAQRRETYGIEVESGVSREDIVAALTEVQAGRTPRDKLALEQLVLELQAWPYLESDDVLRGEAGEPSPYASVTNTGLSESMRRAQAARASEEETPEKDLSDFLPKWFGYSAVYLVSAIPVFITLAVIALLFITSLKARSLTLA